MIINLDLHKLNIQADKDIFPEFEAVQAGQDAGERDRRTGTHFNESTCVPDVRAICPGGDERSVLILRNLWLMGWLSVALDAEVEF